MLVVVATVDGPRTVLAALVLGAVDGACVIVWRGDGRGGVDDSAPVRSAPVRSALFGGDAEMGPAPVPPGVRVCLGTVIGAVTAMGAEALAANLVLAGSGVTSAGVAVVGFDEEVGIESRYQHPE